MNRLTLTACLALTLLHASRPARADERETCAAAADQAQSLRDDGKYRRAREQLLTCARDACPGLIKRDCLDWLIQLDHVAPTVVFAARFGARDVTDVRVSMDGALLTDRLDGKPMAVDLGEHTFRFEHGGVAKEERVLVGAGQKGRNISVRFGPAETEGDKPKGGFTKEAPRERTSPPRSSLVPALVVGGIGVVGLGSFAFFGLKGRSQVDDLERTCKPRCSADDVESARTSLRIADISLIGGVVALGVATYLVLTSGGESAKAAAIDPWTADLVAKRGRIR